MDHRDELYGRMILFVVSQSGDEPRRLREETMSKDVQETRRHPETYSLCRKQGNAPFFSSDLI